MERPVRMFSDRLWILTFKLSILPGATIAYFKENLLKDHKNWKSTTLVSTLVADAIEYISRYRLPY